MPGRVVLHLLVPPSSAPFDHGTQSRVLHTHPPTLGSNHLHSYEQRLHKLHLDPYSSPFCKLGFYIHLGQLSFYSFTADLIITPSMQSPYQAPSFAFYYSRYNGGLNSTKTYPFHTFFGRRSGGSSHFRQVWSCSSSLAIIL